MWFHFFNRMRLWFNKHEPELTRPLCEESTENVISPSEAFYQEIDRHRIPVERKVIAASPAPGTLDFYMWVVWRSWAVTGMARVPLFW